MEVARLARNLVYGLIFLSHTSVAQNPIEDFDSLERAQANINNFEEFIKRLPKSMFHFRSLVYFSLSTQFSSPRLPRVILFRPDMKFIVAFSGRGDVRGGATIEMIQWLDATKEFEFGRFFLDDRRQNGTRFERNPEGCPFCHGGTDPRPNWQPYPTWLGFFGVNADRNVEESTQGVIEAFMNTEVTKHRYQFMDWEISAPDDLEFDHRRPLTHLKLPQESFPSYFARINCTITERLGLLNFKRVADRMNQNLDRGTINKITENIFSSLSTFPNTKTGPRYKGFFQAFIQVHKSLGLFPDFMPKERAYLSGFPQPQIQDLPEVLVYPDVWSMNYWFGDYLRPGFPQRSFANILHCGEKLDFVGPKIYPFRGMLIPSGNPMTFKRILQNEDIATDNYYCITSNQTRNN